MAPKFLFSFLMCFLCSYFLIYKIQVNYLAYNGNNEWNNCERQNIEIQRSPRRNSESSISPEYWFIKTTLVNSNRMLILGKKRFACFISGSLQLRRTRHKFNSSNIKNKISNTNSISRSKRLPNFIIWLIDFSIIASCN